MPSSSSGHAAPSPERTPRAFALAVGVAMLLGAALRLQDLARESLGFDEVMTFRWAQAPLGEFLKQRLLDADPPLFEWVAFAWNHALLAFAPSLSMNEAALRVPTFLFGLATIPVLALAARAALGRWPGVLAAFLAATNPYLVRYSQEARMYALVALLSSGALLFLARTLRDDRRPNDARALGVLLAAAVYAHFFAILALIACTAVTLLARRRTGDARFAHALRGELLAFAIAAPYLAAVVVASLATGRGERAYIALQGPPTLGVLGATATRFAVSYLDHVPSPGTITGALLWGSIAALGALLALGTARPWNASPPWMRAHVAAFAFFPVLALWIGGRFAPVYQDRYLTFVVPALVLLACAARPAWLCAALASIPIAMGAIVGPSLHRSLLRPAFSEAAAALRAECTPADEIAMAPTFDVVFRFYVDRDRALDPAAHLWCGDSIRILSPTAGDSAIAAILDAPRPPRSRLYVVETPDLYFAMEPRAERSDGAWRLVYEQTPLPFMRVRRRDP